MNKPFTLTGNELATAWFACGHAIGHFKKQRGRHARKEQAKYEAVMSKLGNISDHAYPYRQASEEGAHDLEHGDEPIMQLDGAVVKKTRAAARKFNRENP